MTTEKALRFICYAFVPLAIIIMVVTLPLRIAVWLHKQWMCGVLGVPEAVYGSALTDFALMRTSSREALNFVGGTNGLGYADRPVPRFAPTSNDRGPATGKVWIASQRD